MRPRGRFKGDARFVGPGLGDEDGSKSGALDVPGDFEPLDELFLVFSIDERQAPP
jgi:hypothetical protein